MSSSKVDLFFRSVLVIFLFSLAGDKVEGSAEGAAVDAAVEVDGGSPTEGGGMVAVSPSFLFLGFFLDDVLMLLLFLATGALGFSSLLPPSLDDWWGDSSSSSHSGAGLWLKVGGPMCVTIDCIVLNKYQ